MPAHSPSHRPARGAALNEYVVSIALIAIALALAIAVYRSTVQALYQRVTTTVAPPAGAAAPRAPAPLPAGNPPDPEPPGDTAGTGGDDEPPDTATAAGGSKSPVQSSY